MQAKQSVEDWHLAKEGIQLLLNNNVSEAEELFKSKKNSLQMTAGHCFVTFMNALMTFEEDKLQEAQNELKLMERKCAQDIGWLKAVKNKVFGGGCNEYRSEAERIEQQIILADSQVCLALLTFLQQDLSSYVKGGWILRKAWKVYHHTHSIILDMYKKTFGSASEVPGSEFQPWKVIVRDPSNPNLLSPMSSEWSVPSPTEETGNVTGSSASNIPNGRNGYRSPLSFITSSFSYFTENSGTDIPPAIVARLMSAVSFGYGIFQLCISLLPPSLLKLIHFLGFEGDRDIGISALMFARLGDDMRAPLAKLALLWYHTIVRPFFALDGSNVRAGVEAAEELIAESQDVFSNSALFLFFKGRVERLKSQIDEALKAYEAAVKTSPQREVQLLCLHEIGWCHLIQLRWVQAYQSFHKLKSDSRWSKSFYAYLSSVCSGASGNFQEALSLAQEVPVIAVAPNSQLETFILRRARRMPSNDLDQQYCRLLAFELLFLWNALPSCSVENINKILEDCQSTSLEPMDGLRYLIMGASYCCLHQYEEAVASFRTCIEKRAQIPIENLQEEQNQHISAFAMYELAALLCKKEETLQEGKSLLMEAQQKYKGYDFENRLSVRIHAALRNMGS